MADIPKVLYFLGKLKKKTHLVFLLKSQPTFKTCPHGHEKQSRVSPVACPSTQRDSDQGEEQPVGVLFSAAGKQGKLPCFLIYYNADGTWRDGQRMEALAFLLDGTRKQGIKQSRIESW